MHLTNYAINRNADNFEANEGGEDEDVGHKRTVTSVLRLIEETKGVKMETMWEMIDDIAVKTLISAAPQLQHAYRAA
jgi:tubulin polyglutamylase TTLL6/13